MNPNGVPASASAYAEGLMVGTKTSFGSLGTRRKFVKLHVVHTRAGSAPFVSLSSWMNMRSRIACSGGVVRGRRMSADGRCSLPGWRPYGVMLPERRIVSE